MIADPNKKMVKSYATTTVSRLSSLSRGTKTILVTGCAGALLYLSVTWFTARRAKKKFRSQVMCKIPHSVLWFRSGSRSILFKVAKQL